MRGRTWTVLIAASLVVLSVSLLGCDLFTGPEIRIELAAIDTSEVAPTVPSAVDQGRSFVVEIPVLLNCNELGPVEVEEYPAGVVLQPQIRVEVDPNVLCPGAIRFGTHLVELSWEEPPRASWPISLPDQFPLRRGRMARTEGLLEERIDEQEQEAAYLALLVPATRK